MLDPKLLRESIDLVQQQLSRRQFAFDASEFSELEAQRKTLQLETEALQHKKKNLSREIGQAKAKGHSSDDLLEQANHVQKELSDNEK
ncbi:MAG: serine--tRNA ligase, partial [Gammaproteobacteria bacterium]